MNVIFRGIVTWAWIMVLGASVCADAATRHALITGVNTYDNLGADKQLARAAGDARAVAGTLKDLGFQITLSENPLRAEFYRAWQSFLAKVQPSDTVVVFFSGHGVQVGGLNYLLPRDVPKLNSGDDGLLRDESIALQRLLDDVKSRAPGLTLMIVDACRDNPFTPAGGRSVGGARGLARIEQPPEGTFVMFSAGAGETALDRLPGNDLDDTSVYTRRLLPLLKSPGLTLQEMAVQVRDEVRQLASSIGHKQTPAYWDELTGPRVCLAGACGARSAPQPAAQPAPTAPPRSQPAPNIAAPAPVAATQPAAPLARISTDGLVITLEQATRQRERVTLAMQIKSDKPERIALAADGSIRPPDNRYVGYVASLTTHTGATCYAETINGLEELDLDSARNFGGAGYNIDIVNRAMTAVPPGGTLALTLHFSQCESGGATGRLTMTLHKLESRSLGKINIALPAFAIGN